MPNDGTREDTSDYLPQADISVMSMTLGFVPAGGLLRRLLDGWKSEESALLS